MTEALVHRGPDDGGLWVDPEVGMALGSRRLAVLDLSAEGHQPMTSASGRYLVAYNGEIYNVQELRARLESAGARFRGRSDTEVLLAALEKWGLDGTLSELNGMFAFALWDRTRRSLSLVRDRLGEKPLYFAWIGPVLAFASELKALRSVPSFAATIDRRSLACYFRLSCVPAPWTIYEGVKQLTPGSVLTVASGLRGRDSALATTYWSAAEVAVEGATCPTRQPVGEVVDHLEELVGRAVGMRLQADVPVGVFLSGGVDSSTVVALMRARSSGTVRSFTIGFEDAGYDESRHASAVAQHLGTEHTELLLTTGEAQATIPMLPRVYDDPFADPSQIPTYLVSRLAREQVTVALSGDGGDELFGGYNRHAWAGFLLGMTRSVPVSVRRALADLLMTPPPSSWDTWFARLDRLLPPPLRVRLPGVKVQKLASVLPAQTAEDLYRILASTWPRPERLVKGINVGGTADRCGSITPDLDDVSARMMYLDLVTYLPDDILVKLDRASMAVSLESRVPLLDHHVVEYAWHIPAELKIRNRTGKWILRELLRRHLPDELVDRPKAGFGPPIGAWLRGSLRSWADELLAPERLVAEGYLESTVVQECWQEHLSGRRNLEEQLWAILMFEAWLDAHAA